MKVFHVLPNVLIVLSMALIFSCADHQAPTTPQLSVEDYFAKVNTLDIYILPQGTNDSIPLDPNYSLYDYIKYNLADVYRKQHNEVVKLNPPAELESAHQLLVQALDYLASAHDYVLTTIPPGTRATDGDAGSEYLFQNADVGYARVDLASALCALSVVGNKYNITLKAFTGTVDGGCAESAEPKTGQTVGSSTSPVSSVSMVHKALTDANGTIVGPNVAGFEVSTIYAKANEPLTITFDNQNPAPFVFNIAVYRGQSGRVTKEQLVGQTQAYGGEKVHVLTLTLSAGDYTYVDNVHPDAMRGVIRVVN